MCADVTASSYEEERCDARCGLNFAMNERSILFTSRTSVSTAAPTSLPDGGGGGGTAGAAGGCS